MYGILGSAGLYYAMPCAKINYLIDSANELVQQYPACAAFVNGTDLKAHAAVLADANMGKVEAAALLDLIFGASVWLGILVNAVGIEVYVSTPSSRGHWCARGKDPELTDG